MSGTTLLTRFRQMTESYTILSGSKGEFMDKGIFATVEHRKLMELKNCGAVVPERLEELADLAFIGLKGVIKNVRSQARGEQGFFARMFSTAMTVDQEVDLMFTTREELIDHLSAVEVPTDLCPLTDPQKEDLIFLDRAARYSLEASKILDMFKRHHEVIVDSDRSLVIEWVLLNSNRIRAELAK